MSDPTRSRWAGGALATVALALILVVNSTVTASAHDQILSTTPADGQQVMAAPTEVTLRFTEDVLSIGAVVLVVDGHGTDWTDGKVRLEGIEATQALKPGAPDGAYQVRWRVVSADGHPVSGAFAFSVGAVAPTDSIAPTTATAKPAVVDSAGDPAVDGGIPTVVVGIIGASTGIALFALVSFLVRRRTSRRHP